MTKQDLQEYYWVRKNITKLESKLIELNTAATRITSRLKSKHDAIAGQGDTSDKVGNAVAEMELVRSRLEGQIKISYEILGEIEQAIEDLPAREAYLIRCRYIELLTWEQIAVDMNYSWKQIHRIHSEALRQLQ